MASQGRILPRHLAIVMDGNGRWAKRRHLPRTIGHREGRKALRRTVEACLERGIDALTVFAFGRENWRRPPDEVDTLMKLFANALKRETRRLHENNIRLCFIGELTAFSPLLQEGMEEAMALTRDNQAMTLTVAVNYSGQWDITETARQIAHDIEAGRLQATEITEALMQSRLALAQLPAPDLLIRTSGEQRISNFLLWQLAYTELYFTPCLWPDFSAQELDKACEAFLHRQRRFGMTSEQMEKGNHA